MDQRRFHKVRTGRFDTGTMFPKTGSYTRCPRCYGYTNMNYWMYYPLCPNPDCDGTKDEAQPMFDTPGSVRIPPGRWLDAQGVIRESRYQK